MMMCNLDDPKKDIRGGVQQSIVFEIFCELAMGKVVTSCNCACL